MAATTVLACCHRQPFPPPDREARRRRVFARRKRLRPEPSAPARRAQETPRWSVGNKKRLARRRSHDRPVLAQDKRHRRVANQQVFPRLLRESSSHLEGNFPTNLDRVSFKRISTFDGEIVFRLSRTRGNS